MCFARKASPYSSYSYSSSIRVHEGRGVATTRRLSARLPHPSGMSAEPPKHPARSLMAPCRHPQSYDTPPRRLSLTTHKASTSHP